MREKTGRGGEANTSRDPSHLPQAEEYSRAVGSGKQIGHGTQAALPKQQLKNIPVRREGGGNWSQDPSRPPQATAEEYSRVEAERKANWSCNPNRPSQATAEEYSRSEGGWRK